MLCNYNSKVLNAELIFNVMGGSCIKFIMHVRILQ